VTTLLAKANSFLGHARANAPRYVLKAPSKPEILFLCFGGLDFTLEPHSSNLLSKLLKSRTGNASSDLSFQAFTRRISWIIP
jgi:hypothetical protein